MTLKLTKKPASTPTATVTTSIKGKGETVAENMKQESPDLELPANTNPADTPWCQVGFSAGYTHNLGNYQSARVDVSLVIPCKHGEIDKVFEVGKKWVNDRVEALVGELTAE